MMQISAMGQLEPIDFPAVSEGICPEKRANRTSFTFSHYAASLRLWVPSVLEDQVMRSLIVKGYSLHQTYSLGMGTDYIPDAALRPCIRTVLSYRYFDPNDAQWKSAPGKFTCDSYYRCFQEYTSAFAKHPAADPLDRRMEIAPGIFTPSPAEEKCIRETVTKTGNLRGAYQSCGCPEIYPTWPGADGWISQAIRNNPLSNLYWTIKDHYMLSTAGTTQPPASVIPVTPGGQLPQSPGMVDPNYAALLKESEELMARDRILKFLAIGGGVALIVILINK